MRVYVTFFFFFILAFCKPCFPIHQKKNLNFCFLFYLLWRNMEALWLTDYKRETWRFEGLQRLISLRMRHCSQGGGWFYKGLLLPSSDDSEAYDFTQHIPSSTTTAHWLCTKIIHFNTPSIFHHHRYHRRYLLLLSLCYTASFLLLLFLLILSKTPISTRQWWFSSVGLLKFRFLKKKRP